LKFAALENYKVNGCQIQESFSFELPAGTTFVVRFDVDNILAKKALEYSTSFKSH